MATIAVDPVEKTGVLGTLAVVALTLVLAYQLAHWTWVFAAPAQVGALPEGDPAVNLPAIAKLFGAEIPSTTQASSSGLRLKGVVAPRAGTAASAIFSTGSGKDVAVYVGREVQPGVKLSEVRPDHVIVSRSYSPNLTFSFCSSAIIISTSSTEVISLGSKMVTSRAGFRSRSFAGDSSSLVSLRMSSRIRSNSVVIVN